jgi:hypothetical protein
MPSMHNIERVYDPDTLKIMTMAFNNAHGCLPQRYRKTITGTTQTSIACHASHRTWRA